MICVGWTRRPGVELPVESPAEDAVAESAVAEDAVDEVIIILPRYLGIRCDGGTEAVQLSKLFVAKKVEYASSKKVE